MKTVFACQVRSAALPALLACFALTYRAAASTGIFQIIGHVRDGSSNAVAGVDVAVDDYVGDVYFGTTDADGFYVVNVDADSNYRATVNCAQLAAKGFECPAPVALTINDGGLELDFNLLSATPLQITNAFLPHANAGVGYRAQLGAIGGKMPFSWLLATNSASLPPDLSLDPLGIISGAPMTSGTVVIDVQVTDANSTVTNRTLSITVNPRPILSAIHWATNRFAMWLEGASDQNYTIQASTNPSSNWASLFITNNPEASAFLVADPDATNKQKLYRVLIGP
jgi:hypothetical protein